MENQFFEKPILNSPYEYPSQHWELDATGQPTQRIIESRRSAEFITPIPKPKKRRQSPGNALAFGDILALHRTGPYIPGPSFQSGGGIDGTGYGRRLHSEGSQPV